MMTAWSDATSGAHCAGKLAFATGVFSTGPDCSGVDWASFPALAWYGVLSMVLNAMLSSSRPPFCCGRNGEEGVVEGDSVFDEGAPSSVASMTFSCRSPLDYPHRERIHPEGLVFWEMMRHDLLRGHFGAP